MSIRDCWKDKIWSLIPNYIRDSSFTLLVFSIDNKESLNDNYQVLKEYEKLCEENKSKYLEISAKKETNITNLLYSLEISLPILTINT